MRGEPASPRGVFCSAGRRGSVGWSRAGCFGLELGESFVGLAMVGLLRRLPRVCSPGAKCGAVAWSLVAAMACAEPVAVVHRGSAPLPATAVDQNAAPFNVTGLSGITHLGGNHFAAVVDNSNKLVHLEVQFAADGSLAGATPVGGTTLSQSRDYEAIAYTNARLKTVWLADEGGPRLDEFDLKTGELLRTVAAPSPFGQRRNGFGWESLVRRAGGGELWTANEEALTVDGGVSSPTSGTTVRLLRYAAGDESYVAAEQYAYPVEPWHVGDSSLTSAERSGLVELVALPDGKLLALERSLAFSGLISPSFENRLYEVDLAGATNVAGMASLAGATYTPVGKRLLWSGAAAGAVGMNMEGLTVGPRLASGNLTLVGIVDDGGASDPLSANALVAFEVTSAVADPSLVGDANLDGRVDAADVAVLASTYGTSSGAQWEDADFDGDGQVTLDDLAALARALPVAANASGRTTVAANQTDQHAATPEPSAVALIAAAVAMLLAARWFIRRQKLPRSLG
ncbi:MAG: hypothetical protein DCC68_21425 [Planctomycetota bacterium]|nr:MAG: hypothetical protein DCC68_21425 [Planctomycetota bacterium]